MVLRLATGRVGDTCGIANHQPGVTIPGTTFRKEDSMSKWKTIDTFNEDPALFPNRPVMLLMEIAAGENCLVDDTAGNLYVTMGHWYPKDSGIYNGYWEYVGWDWDQDCFVGSTGDKVVGWQELPDVE